MYVCVYVVPWRLTHACMHVCMYVCLYVCMHAFVHACMHASDHLVLHKRTAGHLSTTTARATCQAPPVWPLVHHHRARHLLTTTAPCSAWPKAEIRRSTAALRASSYLTIKGQLATCPPPPRAPLADHHHRIACACIF